VPIATMAEPSSGSSRQADRPPLVVVGAGAAGSGLGRALQRSGWPVDAVVCRSANHATASADVVGGGRPLSLDGLLEDRSGHDALLLLVAVPDHAVPQVAERLATRAWPAGTAALHLSGSVEVDALAPLRAAGLAVGGCHPLKSFVDPERAAASMTGTVFAIEGDELAVTLAERLASDLEGRPFRLAGGRRSQWHAAATHAANHLVALLDQSLDLAEQAGLSRDEARAALLPLLGGTLANLEHHSPSQALTGPVVRGEVDTVARHLDALTQGPADVADAYRALARRALRLAREGRDLDPARADAIARLLDDGDAS
jgi:predicted short-subunit dehydrogenase-like oxidoreductase (DUF2520 family)